MLPLKVPQATPAQLGPERLQVTAWLAASGMTAAVNCCVALDSIVGAVGKTDTPVGAGITVIAAGAELVPLAAEVAVSVTIAGLGTFGGAVYVVASPLKVLVGETMPQAAPEQPDPVTVQVTPLFCGSPCTVAVNGFVVPV